MQETYKIEKKNWAAKLMAVVVVVTMVTSTFVLFAPEASARTGEETGVGYTFKDNDEVDGPTYDWNELVPGLGGSGTLLIDYTTDGAQPLQDIGFTFEMFGREYTEWSNSGDNGFITLGAQASSMWTPYNIPYASAGTAIFGGWFDGGFCKSKQPFSGVYYELQGSAPNREFIVQYQDQVHWYPSVTGCGAPGGTNGLTWQIILHETTNQISIQWKDADGGYGSDNEWLTSGIQGKTDDGVLGLEYIYRGSPAEPDDGDVVLFTPPPPMQNDLKIKSTTIPDPVSLADANVFGAEVFNNGVNCTPVESCTPVNETNIEVNTQIFSVAETDSEYTFDSDDGGFTPMVIQGANKWTNNLNDGRGDHNYGDGGADADPADGAWSSGRKSTTLGGMFSDNQKIHSDGTHILVADTGSDSVLKLDTTTHTVTTILGPDATSLQNVLDVTEDGTYYYTLGRAASTYSSTTVVCKWAISDGSKIACNSSSVRYGVALTYYDDEIFVLQGGSTSTSYRKAIILDATSGSLAATGETVDYYSGVSSYAFAHDIDADDDNGNIYISYRDYYGRVREYTRQGDDTYCATSSCYNQYYAYTRYHTNVDVIDGKAYTTGYYSSSYAGGLRHADTTTKVVTSMWTQYGDNFGYRGSLAVTDDGDIYVTTSYQYRYYYFRNFDDKIMHYDCSASCNNQADAALGPNPASLSALSTPGFDTTASIGMSMSFKVSWQFYYMYEGAYLEVSTDGGSSWSHVPDEKFTKGGYYGTTFGYYGNPLDTTKESWTYYNTNNQYTYMTNNAPWKDQEVNLDAYTGYSDVRLRWVVGFNQYDLSYYDAYFRLDDVVVTLKGADQTYADATEIIDTLAFKESTTVSFFDGDDEWVPSDVGLVAGDSVAVLIKINNTNNDQKMANNRIIEFREVKYVIFNDDFESGDKGWTTGSVTSGSSTWAIDTNDAFGGTHSMDSGMKNPSGVRPADNYIASPALDLSIAVEATAQFMMSYYGYYTYDGYQAQVSEDGGATWSMIKPVDTSQYYTMVNSAYWGNPLRGQPGYSLYGTSTGFSWAPDPQGWVKTEIDLTPYVGQNDVHVRIVTGWSNLCCGPYYQTFFRMDDFAVTGVVHMDNVGLAALDLPDPIEVGSTLPIGTSIINAGLNDQAANAAKMRVQLGPMGIVNMAESDDIDYASQNAAESAGWSMSTGTEGCNTTYSSCGSWGLYGGVTGFALVTDDGSSIDGTHVGFGPATIRDEFQMYYGGGESHVETPAYDFGSAPDDLALTLNHRYNFDYYSGMRAYNGGNVQISTDGGTSWDLLVPDGGYPGSIYNYAGYGNPLYGQQGFVHCGDCSGVSGSAGSNADKYIDSLFDMSDYAGESDVRIKFVAGMYSYQWPGDGEHWHIGALTFSGTGMDKVIFTETVQVTGTGAGGTFVSGEAVSKSWDYEFIVPGEYKVVFDAWIGASPEDGDDYAPDNQRSAVRETMFAVASTTADGERLTPVENNEHYNSIAYADEWTSVVEGGPKNSYKWQHSSAAGGPDSGAPVWWTGTDAYGSSYNGDDTSLVSPVFDLSTASSAKFMMKHRFSMHGYQYSWGGYYYDGGRLEISSNGGQSWSPVTPTSGETYTGNIYNYAFYGHPFVNQPAFIMGSSGGGVTGSWVTSEVRLDDYCGEGFDQMQFRIRLGGTYFNNPTSWQVDDVGIYGLGFDLSQDMASAPYTLELDEAGTITTKVSNQGAGDLGASGAVSSAYAYAYVDDMEGNNVWNSKTDLGNLAQAYFEENTDGDGNPLGTYTTYGGQSTDTISFEFPGTDMPGVYTIGVRVADVNGDVLSDLFGSNNQHQHMLLVGMSADMGSPVLTADDTWTEVTDEPSYVGDGALGTSWDKTAINTIVQDISIGDMFYSPADVTVQVGTVVKWTNDDSTAHTVSDKDGVWDSGPIGAGSDYSKVFSEVGTYTYYCTFHPMMEGTITVEADVRADQQVRTNYMEVWSSDSYLVFWANYDLGSADQITVYAQPKGASIEDASTIRLDGANGFEIVDGMDHDVVGDSLVGNSDGWNPYYMSLSTTKLGYSTLDYDPESDNAYSFVFRARGIDGSAEIGGVQLIRTNEFGMYFSKTDFSKLTYEIFPSLAVEIDYMARNIGTKDNTFQMTPALILQGNKDADAGYWEITPNVLVNGNAVTATSEKVGDDFVYSISLSPDDQAQITMRFVAPAYNQAKGQPAGNSKFDVDMNPFDVESNATLRDDPKSTLFIKPSQFVLGEMSFNKAGVIEGTNVSITVRAWNEGNYASDVLVVMYMLDPSGTMYATPEGNQRMTRIAHTTVPLMAPKPVLDSQGEYKYWYEATAVWEDASIPGTTAQDFETVDVYAWINPFPLEQVDKDAGFKPQDEFQDQSSDNDASGIIAVVKDKASTPSFAVGLLGMSMAALVAAIGASLRREEE